MPDRGSPRLRWFLIGAVCVLALIVVVLSIIGFSLRQKVTNLERDARAEKLATSTAEVATCYAAARGRPRLIIILRLLQTTAERDVVAQAAIRETIDEYQMATPTVLECDKRAIEAGFRPEDFPSANRGEEGNGR